MNTTHAGVQDIDGNAIRATDLNYFALVDHLILEVHVSMSDGSVQIIRRNDDQTSCCRNLSSSDSIRHEVNLSM